MGELANGHKWSILFNKRIARLDSYLRKTIKKGGFYCDYRYAQKHCGLSVLLTCRDDYSPLLDRPSLWSWNIQRDILLGLFSRFLPVCRWSIATNLQDSSLHNHLQCFCVHVDFQYDQCSYYWLKSHILKHATFLHFDYCFDTYLSPTHSYFQQHSPQSSTSYSNSTPILCLIWSTQSTLAIIVQTICLRWY